MRDGGCLPFCWKEPVGMNNDKGFSKISKKKPTRWHLPFEIRLILCVKTCAHWSVTSNKELARQQRTSKQYRAGKQCPQNKENFIGYYTEVDTKTGFPVIVYC